MTVLNEFGQIIGDPVDWKPALFPSRLTSLEGENVLLEVVDVAKHGTDLYDALSYDTNGESWTYLPYGPFETVEAFNLGLSHISSLSDTVTYVIIDKKSENRKPLGTCSYLRINPEHGSIEVGHLHYSKLVKQSTVTTEAMYLMMKHAFENLHYRRYEWKCNSLNKPSCDAAVRLGLLCEGTFRNCLVVKGHNRDTTWFAATDSDWETRLKVRFEKWLSAENFDEHGKQLKRLQDC